MLDIFETMILLEETIYKFDNPNIDVLSNNFKYHFSELHDILYEKNTNDVEFARSFNSKMNLIDNFFHIHDFNFKCSSNIIPKNVTYDFYIKLNKNDFIKQYQLKLALSKNHSFPDQDLNYWVEKYSISIKNNNYLVIDNSFQNKELKTNLIETIFENDNLYNLLRNNKIIIHNDCFINKHNIYKLYYYNKNLLKLK